MNREPRRAIPRTGLGAKLTEIRLRLGWTQEGIGREFLVCQRTIQSWEVNRYPVPDWALDVYAVLDERSRA